MNFAEWIQYGTNNKWCSHIICHTHDAIPFSDQELDEWNAGDDACVHIVRLYESAEQFDAAQGNL